MAGGSATMIASTAAPNHEGLSTEGILMVSTENLIGLGSSPVMPNAS